MYCGLDLGSRSVKVALAGEDGGFTLRKFATADFYRRFGSCRDGKLAVDFRALLPEGAVVERVISTGYGRQAAAVAGARAIPEIKAHVLGAVHLTGLLDFTLLDLGGQDSKVALVRKGRIVDFLTNDKCAASTGRYLENMAAVLGITLEELGQHYRDPVELNSTCAIFGESELIGKMVEGHPLSSLAAGVNYSIFRRIRPMLVRLLSDTLVFTGGVAQNRALVEILSRELGVKVVVPDNPQYTGAIGCCVEAKLG
ncbi:acyl-CoA dehydratase activase [Desulfovirgula thermocuniculi]|uniref:acyl-CoA dehydratase activase n=1 Tax=Desulfovirgula thermocuniculi TaxID=348842 RepID=UPI00042975DC|nr:acyl-CoA dehydratase activase [Desulfovirgula thermocuniculi]